MHAREHGIRYISGDTLKFYDGWDASDGNTVSFASLFNVTHWNSRAMRNQSMPLPLIVFSRQVTAWIRAKTVALRAFEEADVITASGDPSVCWFWQSLRPAAPLMKAVESVRPVGMYGVLHARIENDLNTPGIPAVFRTDRLSLPTIYGMISNFSHPCLSRPDRFYMCVMASDVTEPEEASMLERRLTPWQNVSLELRGSEAVRQAGLEGSKVQGAVLDPRLARGAKFFIGEEGLSTFAMAIMTSRSCAGLQCNVHLGPDGMGEAAVDLDKDIVMWVQQRGRLHWKCSLSRSLPLQAYIEPERGSRPRPCCRPERCSQCGEGEDGQEIRNGNSCMSMSFRRSARISWVCPGPPWRSPWRRSRFSARTSDGVLVSGRALDPCGGALAERPRRSACPS
ncbi:unnamed protein product [Prorocentrum cordatum]|uniref:Uncharacterized protein n=1 Tax=Prorocentrum cordatum TaxID=2364126 RepID=A0ABN9TU18_9DINO|nr:unnamed protein product [Polarella glacialis]